MVVEDLGIRRIYGDGKARWVWKNGAIDPARPKGVPYDGLPKWLEVRVPDRGTPHSLKEWCHGLDGGVWVRVPEEWLP